MKDRDISIDILKFIAALAITNSHFDALYGDYSILASGGAIGDALFFFCSGYTLFLGRNSDFFNWYKRRVNRIYPTVFSWAFIASIFGWLTWYSPGFYDIVLRGGGWFVSCIMIYYIFLWFIRNYIHSIPFVFVLSCICILGWYFIKGIDTPDHNMYGYGYFKWVFFFLYMLLGAILGKKNQERKKMAGVTINAIMLLISVILFYGLYWFKCRSGWYDYLQMLSLLPLAGICYYLYQLCNSNLLNRIYQHSIIGPIIKTIGGLCLEIYLVQSTVDLYVEKIGGFPFNILLAFILIIVSAYLLRCISRVWKQTFQEHDYNWKEIIKLY